MSSFNNIQTRMIFSDRVDELKNSIEFIVSNPDNTRIYAYQGIGGLGKSRLCEKIYSTIISKHNNVIPALCSMEQRREMYAEQILYQLRHDLGRNSKISFLAFDIGYLAFMENKYPSRSIKSYSNLFDKNADIISELISNIEIYGEEIPGGTLLIRAIKWIMSKNNLRKALKTKPHLNAFLSTKERDIYSKNLLDFLPKLLADDINHHCTLNPNDKLVFFIDEYESVTLGQGKIKRQLSEIDKSLYELVLKTPESIWFVFSREDLSWIDNSGNGKSNMIKGIQLKIEGLPKEDADFLLINEPVNETNIREAIIHHSKDEITNKIHPFLLELHIKNYKYNKEHLNKPPNPKDFILNSNSIEEMKSELIDRFLRNVLDDVSNALKSLSILRVFNHKLFSKTASSIKDLALWDKITCLNFINKIDDYWVISNVYREAILADMSKVTYIELNKQFYEYFTELAFDFNHPEEINVINCKSLVEATYHLGKFNPEALIKWYQNNIEPFRRNSNFHTIIRVIEIITAELSKRKLDDDFWKMYFANHLSHYHRLVGSEEQAVDLIEFSSLIYKTNSNKVKLHPLYIDSQLSATETQISLGNYHLAEELLKLAEEHFEKNKKTIKNIFNLEQTFLILKAKISSIKGDYYSSYNFLYDRHHKIKFKGGGSDIYSFMHSYYEISKMLENIGRLSEAEALMWKCQRFYRNNLGETNRDTWVVQYKLASLLVSQKRFNEALSIVNDLSKSTNKIPSLKNHKWVLLVDVLRNRISVESQGNSIEEKTLLEGIENIKTAFGENEIQLLYVYLDLVNFYIITQETKKAKEACEVVLEMLTNRNDDYGRQITGIVKSKLGDLLIQQNNNSLAAKLLLESENELKASYGPDHYHMIECLSNQLKLAKILNSSEEIQELSSRINDLQEIFKYNIYLRTDLLWKKVSAYNKTSDFLESIVHPPTKTSDIDPSEIYTTTIANLTKIPFEIIKVQFDNNQTVVNNFLIKVLDSTFRIDGQSSTIKSIFDKAKLKITEENVIDYLWLYTELLLFKYAHKYILLDNINRVKWRYTATKEQKMKVKASIKKSKVFKSPPLEIEFVAKQVKDFKLSNNSLFVLTTLLSRSNLSEVLFEIRNDGMVQMVAYDEILNNLDVATYSRIPEK